MPEMIHRAHTNVQTKALGKVRLRPLVFHDEIVFLKLLNEIEDGREYVARSVYNQVVSPKLTYKSFSRIPNDELRSLARVVLHQDRRLFESFEETTDDELFNNFRNTIATSLREFALKTKELFKAHQEDIKKAILAVAEVGRVVSKVYESLGPVINSWTTWVEQNQNVFSAFRELAEKLQESYKLTDQEASRVLIGYKWFMTPSLPPGFIFEAVRIGRGRGNQRGPINKLFIDHLSSNDYENLSIMVVGWANNALFAPRMKIFRDCISALRDASRGNNPCNLLLPTLIAQIDGIQTAYMHSKGLAVTGKNKMSWEDPTGAPVVKKVYLRTETRSQVALSSNFIDIANEVLFDILFQKALTGEKASVTFSRHKIMHGELLTYGRIDNAMRAFLVLDFLAALK